MTSSGPPRAHGRVAVIDIGSNSVRMVVFDLRQGMPLPVLNEKATCRLAEGLAASGRLAAGNMAATLDCLTRFAALAAAMQLERLFTLATAAIRDADNGAALVAEIERVVPGRVIVLDGEEEARLSAQGVLSGLPNATGIAGDLGGGSLELTEVAAGAVGRGITLPLGPLRLAEATEGDLGKARKTIERALDRLDWLARSRGTGLYLVGGAWRALARAMMTHTDYPLHIIHGYSLSGSAAEALAAYVVAARPAALARLPDVPRQRVESLPLAALVLAQLLAVIKPVEVCFSAHGLREGYVLDRMRGDSGEHDALRIACDWWARQSDLEQETIDLLMSWTAPLFAGGGEIDLRLRRAACQLSNIGWHQHPEYRAQQALDEILHAPTLPLRHAERSFLALVLWYRYGGRRGAPEAIMMAGLLPSAMAHRARILGLALKLAYKLSGGAPSILQEAALVFEQGSLQLRAPASLAGEPVERDLASLAKAVDNDPPE